MRHFLLCGGAVSPRADPALDTHLPGLGSRPRPVGHGVRDGVALHFEDGLLREAVTARPGAGHVAYTMDGTSVRRTFHPARVL